MTNLLPALAVILLVVHGAHAQGVTLERDGVAVPNFGLLGHSEIDTSDDPEDVGSNLVCRTDNTSCCRVPDNPNGGGFGNWYYPNGGVVEFPFENLLPSGQIYRQRRGAQIVRLRREGSDGTTTANGIYRCVVADRNGVNQTRYVGLYTNGAGAVTVGASLQFALIDPGFRLFAITSGGPPTTFSWRGPNGVLSNADSTLTVQTSITSQVQLQLRVTGNVPGEYTFTATNSRTTGDVTSTFTVTAGAMPTGLMAVQQGVGIRVTWSPPASGPAPTGYVIYYQAGSSGVRTIQTGSTTIFHVLTDNLVNGAEHRIEVAALANIPGERAGPVTVDFLLSPDAPVVTLTGAMATGVTVVWNSQGGVDSYEVLYNRTTGSAQQGTCPGFVDMGSATANGGDTSLTLQNIEEFSNYTITVIAMNRIASVSTAVEFISPSAASSPPSVVLVASTNTTIAVSWTALSCIDQNSQFTIVNYTVRYGRESGSERTTVLVPGTFTAFTVSNLEPGTRYSIEVAAVNSNGETGEFSEPVVESTSGGGSNAGAVAAAVIVVSLFVIGVVVGIIIAVLLWRRHWAPATRRTTSRAPSTKVRYTAPAKNGDNSSRREISKAVEPTIDTFPKNMRVTEGEAVYLEVKLKGNPVPKFKWYYNGSELRSDYSIDVKENGSINIPSSEMRHTGVYRLVVTNAAGTAEKEVKLAVTVEGMSTPTAMRKSLVLQAVKVSDFGKHVAQCHANSDQEFRDMYDAIPDGNEEHPSTIATMEENRLLNRFANIVVYDDNRVLLEPIGDYPDCQNEYINACYVDGFSTPKKFLATQGPLPKTNVDFWRLVWQEKVPCIVMITNIKEGNKIKCQQYWPDSGSVTYEPFSIKVTEQQVFPDYVVRTLELSLAGSSSRSLKVTQYHFTAWPDHGVPDYATPILAFHRRVISQHKTSRGPMLVHCSAGVGRTGTFMCIDSVLEQAHKEGVVDIPGAIKKIRQQRMKMVQTAAQFVFIHDAVLESVTCGDTQISAVNLRVEIKKLNEFDSKSSKTGYENQFKVLEQVSPKPDEVNRSTALQHPAKNRTTDYLPADRSRVVLRGEHPDYIHAVNVNGYKQEKAFIIAQGPMRSTARDFWKMVFDRKCGAIVMLSGVKEAGRDACMHYWPPTGSKSYTDYTVELLDQNDSDGFIVRSFSIVYNKSGKAHQVTQFHIQNWTPDGKCSNMKTIVAVLDEVAKVQRKTGNRPIVVHCSDTVSRSGMFCAIATTIERCKTEGVVDVFQAVKALRVQKPGAVLTVEQYKTVFDVVLEYLDSFDDYANFQ